MLTAELQEGRLIEVKAEGHVSVAEVMVFRSQFTDNLVRAAQRVVICTDLRTAAAFGPEVSLMLLGMMKSDNPILERSGHLTQPDTAFGSQLEEMVLLANNPSRRAFAEAEELTRFLAPVLSPSERLRLRQFLQLS